MQIADKFSAPRRRSLKIPPWDDCRNCRHNSYTPVLPCVRKSRKKSPSGFRKSGIAAVRAVRRISFASIMERTTFKATGAAVSTGVASRITAIFGRAIRFSDFFLICAEQVLSKANGGYVR